MGGHVERRAWDSNPRCRSPEMTGLPPELLVLPEPLDRLLATAAAMDGVEVTFMDETLEDELDAGTAALVAYGQHVILSPRMGDGQTADVLAMAIAVTCKMTNTPGCGGEGEIVAPVGWVAIRDERLPYLATGRHWLRRIRPAPG
jgi:hypothetical protein